MKRLLTICAVAALVLAVTGMTQAGVITVTTTDMTPTAPLSNPFPSSYQPRYISGFGGGDSFTVFFEDRDASGVISYVSTTSGPAGFPASATATDISDTHFCVKDWPINIGGTDYAYRAWGAVGNNPQHHFYVSNNLTNWTLVSTFTIPSNLPAGVPGGWVYYGFHDVIELNGTYYAWGECNQGHTLICRSTNGDDVWKAFDRVGGLGSGPLQLPGPLGGTPTGAFFDLGLDRGYGKIMVPGDDSAIYLAINTAAKPSLPPAQLEAAFIDPSNWMWHDGTTGLAANPILSKTSEHDLRECWVVPNGSDWIIVYDADFVSGDGDKALGYAILSVLPPPTEVWVDDDFDNSTPGWGTTHFATIQDGIDAVAGSIVNVANGTYNATTSNSTQHPANSDWWQFVTIDKSLNLIGESRDSVILDGTQLSGAAGVLRPTCIWISASNVTVKNLTIRNFHHMTDYSVYSYGVVSWKDLRNWGTHDPSDTISHVTLDNLKVQDCLASIYFMHTEYPTVKNCIVENGLADGIWIAMGGVHAVVQNNTVNNSSDHGIWVGGAGWCGPSCPDATITNNYIDGAREGGISFVSSDGAIISGNNITNVAGEGWSVGALSLKDGVSNVEAYNNTIYNNDGSWGGYSGTGHGVGIDGTPSNINLHHNDIYDNAGYGCYNYSTVVVMATNNWWGDASGPYHPTSWYFGLLEITNPSGLGDEVSDYVLYLPWKGMGFVTGGGTIWSEVDEAAFFMSAAGEANFGFVAKYKKGKNVPDGSTNFVFQAGDLHFHSSDYDWLVVAGDTAKFKGTGTIEGLGDGYKFMLWAGDNDPDVDTFRILIWEGTEEDPVDLMYDNGPNDPITGGSIIIHKVKGKK